MILRHRSACLLPIGLLALPAPALACGPTLHPIALFGILGGVLLGPPFLLAILSGATAAPARPAQVLEVPVEPAPVGGKGGKKVPEPNSGGQEIGIVNVPGERGSGGFAGFVVRMVVFTLVWVPLFLALTGG